MRVPGTSFVALILVLVVVGVLGVVVVNTKINENALRLAQLEKQQAALDLDEQQLQQAITDAQAPGNLTAKARQLGLVESGPPTYIRLSDGRVIGVPQPGNGSAGRRRSPQEADRWHHDRTNRAGTRQGARRGSGRGGNRTGGQPRR